MTARPSKPAAPNTGIAPRFQSGRHWPGVGRRGRYVMFAWRILLVASLVFMTAFAGGCVHRIKPAAANHGLLFTISLPPLKLAEEEYIQSVEVLVEGGRIATINRTWDDWDIGIKWDSPNLLAMNCEARHFSAGFASTREFDRFITVEAASGSFDITATVNTDSTDNTGRGERVYHLSRSDFILTPRPSASVWSSRAAFYHTPESKTYIVQWGYSAKEIAECLHLTEGQLSSLNPGVDLSQLKAGQVLNVSELERK